MERCLNLGTLIGVGLMSSAIWSQSISLISNVNDVTDVMMEWGKFVAEQKERELVTIITEEKLKPEETRKFLELSLQAGEIKTTGTDIDKLMPPVSRFGGGNRAAKKQAVIERLKAFFEKFFGV